MVKRAMLPQVRLRRHRPGDLGWVVQRHGELYWKEYGYDERFEALVAGIVADLVKNFDSRRERCWISERKGHRLGFVCVVRLSPRVAKLRLLILEPEARGFGLGTRLVKACVGFARAAGYRQLVLWTQSELMAARAIYEKLGFKKVRSEAHRSFGKRLVGEYWELGL